jgi:hypothetical protein
MCVKHLFASTAGAGGTPNSNVMCKVHSKHHQFKYIVIEPVGKM